MAHLMAQAITHQFPNEHIEFGVGPVIDHGFYYDVEMDHRLNEADLKNIEKKMKELIKKKLPIERKVMKRDEAIKHFEDINQKLKVELILQQYCCYSAPAWLRRSTKVLSCIRFECSALRIIISLRSCRNSGLFINLFGSSVGRRRTIAIVLE